MSAKQDRQGVRTATDVVQRYNFGQSFSEVKKSIRVATDTAEQAEKVARKAHSEVLQLSDSISLTVENGVSTAQIKLKVGDKEIPATIEMKGLVTFSNLANADGTTVINGSNILTGEIIADLIKAGIINSKTGRLYLDLDTGEFSQRKVLESWSSNTGLVEVNNQKAVGDGFRYCLRGVESSASGNMIGMVELRAGSGKTGVYVGSTSSPTGEMSKQAFVAVYDAYNDKGIVYVDEAHVMNAPTDSDSVVNKKYVDDQIAALKAQLGL